MIKNTPPMGWNSWNTFGHDINDQLIRDSADILVSSGLAECGYDYIVIDDCWSKKERDESGRLVPDPEKFPNGMKSVSDYVHSKGLKFGMYSCAGTLTCALYPGSYDHEFIDAQTFAEWGVDFLKYDFCYQSDMIEAKYLYRRMGLALKNCGRDILFSACNWGYYDTGKWIRETGANMWRSTGDIFNSWESIKKLTLQQEEILPYGGAGCFNDMDMLVVGMYDKGFVNLEKLNDTQYKTHFSIWSLFGSPLMIGCDLRDISKESLEILSNKEVIKINQDADCRQVMKLNTVHNKDAVKIYARYLENGDIAIGLFNFGDEKCQNWFNLEQIGLPETTGKTIEMHELWTGETITAKNGLYVSPEIDAYDSLLFRCKVVDA